MAAKRADLSTRLGEVCEIARTYERHDLVQRLRQTALDARSADVRVLVVGGAKVGKSSLINASIGGRFVPGDELQIARTTQIVRRGSENKAFLIQSHEPDERRPIEFSELRDAVYEPRCEQAGATVLIECDRPVLLPGLSLIEMPGTDDHLSGNAATAIAMAAVTDGVVFVTDSDRPLDRSSVDTIEHLVDMNGRLLVAMTKIDFHPAWRRVANLNRKLLSDRDLAVPLACTSSELAIHASTFPDPSLRTDSGLDELSQFISSAIATPTLAERQACIEREIVAAARQLEQQLEADIVAVPPRSALESPASPAEELRRLTTVLNDRIIDLSAELERRVRDIVRHQAAQMDNWIDSLDPADHWSDVELTLAERMNQEVVALLEDTAEQIAELTAAIDLKDHETQAITLTPEAVGPVALGVIRDDRPGAVRRSLLMLRGGYSGMLMFGFLASSVAISSPLLPLAAPLAGVALGRHGVREQDERRLEARRATAKRLARQYCADVAEQASHQARTMLRQSQRSLRDVLVAKAREREASNRKQRARVRSSVGARDSIQHRQTTLQQHRSELSSIAAHSQREAERLASL